MRYERKMRAPFAIRLKRKKKEKKKKEKERTLVIRSSEIGSIRRDV